MPEKLHRCVEEVQAKGGAENAWAVCNAAMKKGSKKKRRGKKRGRAYMAEPTAPDPLLLAESGPDRLRSLLESSMQACMTAPGAQVPRCRAQALLAAYNAGWSHGDGAWQEGAPRATTFAEKVDALGAPAAFYMRDVKILEPGVWTNGATGEKVTLAEEDLRKIAADSNSVLARFKPPLLPDHPQKGRVGRAVGWAGTFYAKPDGLYTQAVTDIPPAFASLLEAKQYKRLSAGLRRDYREDATGKTYGMIVDHIAALGAAKPIIDTLPDLPEVLAASEMSGEVLTLVPTDESENKGDQMPNEAGNTKQPDQIEKALAEMKAHSEELQKANAESIAAIKAENEKLKADLAAIHAENAKRSKDAKEREVTDFVDGKVREGVIVPAARDMEIATGIALSESALVYTFSEGNETKQTNIFDAWKASVERRPRVIKLSESAPQPLSRRPGSDRGLDDSQLRSIGSSAEAANKVLDAIESGKTGFKIDQSIADSLNQ